MALLSLGGENALEAQGDGRAMHGQCLLEGASAAVSHGLRQQLFIGRGLRQLVGLGVIQILDAMLDPPEEVVSGAQHLYVLRREQTLSSEQIQHLQGRTRLQFRFPPATDQLEHLGDEFDFADAARAELDVIGQFPPRHLFAYLCVQFAHGPEGAVVEILAEHEGPHRGGQRLLRGVAAGQRPRLDPGIAFPLAALAHQILLQGVVAHGQRTGVTPGAQAHVDAKYIAFIGGLVDQANEAFAGSREELMVAHAARAFTPGFTFLGIDEDEIDVGGDVEFAAAQLAHADHHQFLAFARFRARHAQRLLQLLHDAGESAFDGDFGQQGHGRADFSQAGAASQVALHQREQYPLAQAPQADAQVRTLLGIQAGVHGNAGPPDIQLRRNVLKQCRMGQHQTAGIARMPARQFQCGRHLQRGRLRGAAGSRRPGNGCTGMTVIG